MTTKLDHLTRIRDEAATELASLAARVEALDAAIAELPKGGAAEGPMKAEREAIAQRLAYLTERHTASVAAWTKEPKPAPVEEEPTK